MSDQDLDIARAMLNEGPQCAFDYEADDAFAEAIGIDVRSIRDEDRIHRRRVGALRTLVNRGEAIAWWTGIPEPPPGAPRRARMYAKQ